MHTETKRRGKSTAVRLPAQLISALGLAIDSPVEMRLEEGQIVIKPLQKQVYELEALLSESSEQFMLDEDDRDWLDATSVGKEEPY
jgi:antitoxin ChpS